MQKQMSLLRHAKPNRIVTKKSDVKEMSALLRKQGTLVTLSPSFKKRYLNAVRIGDVRL